MPQRAFAMPAEWAPHEATWLSWPHNRETWPDGLEGAEAALVEAVVALADGEMVHVNTMEEGHVRGLFAGRVPPQRLACHAIATDDA